jgi:hypothetical protein
MPDSTFKTNMSMEEIEENYAEMDFFSGLMESLEEVAAYSSNHAKTCPYCRTELEEKSVVQCEDGGSDVLALCEQCLRTWRWHRDASGRSQPMEQYFFG